MKSIILFLAFAFMELGCSRNEAGKKPTVGNADAKPVLEGFFEGKPYFSLDQGSLQKNDTAVSGRGSFRFRESLGDISSDKRIKMTFSLQDSGSLELHTHARDRLEDGVVVKFKRTGDNLYVFVKAQGRESTPKVIAGLDAAREMTIVAGVHNSKAKAQVFVWEEGREPGEAEEANFNSDFEGGIEGLGQGRYWGFVLDGALLKTVGMSDANLDSESDQSGEPVLFSVESLHLASEKSLKRFQRLAISNAKLDHYLAWKTSKYIWVKIVYTIPGFEGKRKKETIYFACHPHGASFGCHKKSSGGPDEPRDESLPG